MVRDGGHAYGAIYRLLDGRRRARLVSRLVWPWVRPAAVRLLAHHPVDAVVAFHPLPVHTVSSTLAHLADAPPLIAVGTDLVVMHAFYADPRVRRYLVATEAARAQLTRHGVPAQRVEVTGLPVDPLFVRTRQVPRPALRARLGLDPDRPLVLAMAGGEGFEPLEAVVESLSQNGLQAQVVAIAGHNRRLRARLAAGLDGRPVRVEGFVRNVHEWMGAADLLLTKAGPNTIAEAAVMGLPMVLWGAIPAQETPNARLAVAAGAGIWAPDPERAVATIRRLLDHPQEAAQMRRKAWTLAQPDAADRVADALWRAATEGARGPNGNGRSFGPGR
jgi:1,2-diacylglycerol 3-beta-galactosyltransferase